MKILIATDFYAEYELYETDKPEGLKNYISLMLLGSDIELDENKYKLIGNQDTIETQEAIEQADKIIYISDIAENRGL